MMLFSNIGQLPVIPQSAVPVAMYLYLDSTSKLKLNVRDIPYSLRPRAHDRELPVANTAMRKNFITRMLYSKQ